MMIGMSHKRSAAALVTLQGEGTSSAVRRLSPPSARCRPGESPRWVRLDLTPQQAAELRNAASTAGVALDAWLAITLEFAITLRLLARGLGSPAAARARLGHRIETCPLDMARDPAWRVWQASLSGRAGSRADELPEVVLPQRLVARTAGVIDPSVALAHAIDWPLARACELAACGRGQTPEAFILQLALLDLPREQSGD
jgi:hypothetical protein